MAEVNLHVPALSLLWLTAMVRFAAVSAAAFFLTTFEYEARKLGFKR